VSRVVIDPITRIEGHLRVEVEVENGKVVDAWSSGTLFRGMEKVLVNREPTDAFYIAQRICGVCPISHGHASTMATEKALGIKIPEGARLVRNIIEAAQFLHSHVLWFYTLGALDYVDVVSALKANIADTYALAEKAGTQVADFGAVQARLKAFVEGGQLSIFTNGWWGNPAYKLPPELNLIAVAHYLEALEVQAEAAQVIAAMGGKFPHFMTSLPGGTVWVPTEEKLDDVLFRLLNVKNFVMNAMVPDLLAIAPYYLEAATFGKGCENFLAWGVFEDKSMDPKKRLLPEGSILKGSLGVVAPDSKKIMEYVDRSWYKPEDGGLNPQEGKTNPDFTKYDTAAQYSWGKAPRLDGKPMEVGPLARVLIAYSSGNPAVKKVVDGALAKLGATGKPEILISLLGRVAARVLESAVIAEAAPGMVNELVEAIKGGDAKLFTDSDAKDGKAGGMWEAPRGAVGHWIDIQGGKIANYQVVAPSTWLISPRDKDKVRGPVEEALIGCPVDDPKQPINAVRVVRSFDP
jgi:hydrogenase large subunit